MIARSLGSNAGGYNARGLANQEHAEDKLRVWEVCSDLEKVCFMDLDMIVMQAMDPVFAFQKYLVDKTYLFTAARGEEQLGDGKRCTKWASLERCRNLKEGEPSWKPREPAHHESRVQPFSGDPKR